MNIERYKNVTIDNKFAIFKDVTSEMNELKKGIKDDKLAIVADVCNRLLMPNVLCPWGCSCYLHKHGCLPMDLVFQRYLLRAEIKTIHDIEEISMTFSAREDYIRDDIVFMIHDF